MVFACACVPDPLSVAILSDRINAMQEHQEAHTRDVNSIRVMRALTEKRKKLMRCARSLCVCTRVCVVCVCAVCLSVHAAHSPPPTDLRRQDRNIGAYQRLLKEYSIEDLPRASKNRGLA